MCDGGMITVTEALRDFGQGAFGEFMRQVNRDLARPGNVRGPPAGDEFGKVDRERVRDRALDPADQVIARDRLAVADDGQPAEEMFQVRFADHEYLMRLGVGPRSEEHTS